MTERKREGGREGKREREKVSERKRNKSFFTETQEENENKISR